MDWSVIRSTKTRDAVHSFDSVEYISMLEVAFLSYFLVSETDRIAWCFSFFGLC